MGRIKSLQTDYLEQGSELVNFKRYSSDGTHLETSEENVLFTAKRDLAALDSSLIKEFERPIKQVVFKTESSGMYVLNKNAHFGYGNLEFDITTPASGTSEIISDTDESTKALSYGKFFKSTYINTTTNSFLTMLKNSTPSDAPALSSRELEVSFNYFVDTDETDDAFEISLKIVAENYLGIGFDKRYSFKDNEWRDASSVTDDDARKLIAIKTVNSWGRVKLKINEIPSESTDDKFWNLDATINNLKPKPHNASTDFNKIYIDNFYIAELPSIQGDSQVTLRKRLTSAGTLTGEIESKDNKLATLGGGSRQFSGEIQNFFKYKRPRDSQGKTLEQIVTQQILNDNRNSMIRYEGTFRAKSRAFLSMHNKIWVNYVGFSDAVSTHIDGLSYNVKKATYDVQLHLPNQDNDVDSILEIKYE
jgi:hypothetical protein